MDVCKRGYGPVLIKVLSNGVEAEGNTCVDYGRVSRRYESVVRENLCC